MYWVGLVALGLEEEVGPAPLHLAQKLVLNRFRLSVCDLGLVSSQVI